MKPVVFFILCLSMAIVFGLHHHLQFTIVLMISAVFGYGLSLLYDLYQYFERAISDGSGHR